MRRPASGEWRYRRKGSLAVNVAGPRRGTWRDHEADVGGGLPGAPGARRGPEPARGPGLAASPGVAGWPRTDAGRGAGRFSGRAAARHRTLPKNGSTGLSGPGENPDSAPKRMFALIGPSRCGSGPSRSQRPQTIRRADGWPGVVCGGLPSHCRRPSAGWQRLTPRLAQSWRPLLHRARADCPASSSSTSTPTGSQPSTSPAPDGLPKRSFGQMAGAVCVLGLQGHGGVNVAEGLADAPGPGRTTTLARRLHGRDGGIPQPRARPLAGWLRDRPHLG